MRIAALVADCSLKELNTWGCGGRCLWLAAPSSAEGAAEALLRAAGEGLQLYMLGGGSNVLVQDGQIKAAVLSSANLDGFSVKEEGANIIVNGGAGVEVKRLLGAAFEASAGGLEFLTGIPGSAGGALAGNAGAGGKSFGPYVEWIETANGAGGVRRWPGSELRWEYRSSPWFEEQPFITAFQLCLPKAEKQNIINNIRHYSGLKRGQPIGAKTAGCVFKNPPGNSAGRLLDGCGCKGLSVGGARVSSAHANFIENREAASARDIFTLAELCRSRVADEYGITLDYEIKFFGAFQAQ